MNGIGLQLQIPPHPVAALTVCGVSAPVVMCSAFGATTSRACVRFYPEGVAEEIFNLCILREYSYTTRKKKYSSVVETDTGSAANW